MSVHIEAKVGEIAKNVLLPGDPMRAKWIAETFFENPILYNDVRGMLGYTGTYKGIPVSVQGTGMGVPSTLIYCHELINFYGCTKLIRVGSAGSYQEGVKVRDIVVAMAASSTNGMNNTRFINADFSPTASFNLFQKAILFSDKNNIPIKAGNILTTDEFYEDNFDSYKHWADYGILAVDMETSGLYTIAAKYKVDALTVLTISDSLVSGEKISADERERSFTTMIELALGIL
jgi:purine-nucleoside phosphorylase